MKAKLPAIYRLDRLIHGNSLRQLVAPAREAEGEMPTLTSGRVKGYLFKPASGDLEVAIVGKKGQALDGYSNVLRANPVMAEGIADCTGGEWLKHPEQVRPSTNTREANNVSEVLASWLGAFKFIEARDGSPGMRTPQLGAVHAALAHWTNSSEAGTIVLPTGTGKTDTMIAILVSARIEKLLVIVPTDALRTQICNKFLELGILKARFCQVLAASSLYPSVCGLRRVPRTIAEVDDVFGNAHIIVATSAVAGRCGPSVQERMARHCRYLFIDEAHHAEAPTWRVFKEKFSNGRVLQFTATPFREDGQLLDGHIIYRYSLRQAKEAGYFKPIEFEPVVEFRKARADKAIAEKAVARLRADLARGHVLMARAESVTRAREIFEHYRKYDDLKPVELHTGIKSQKERDASMRMILSGESRIVVCVDMLGEGFDLPELKIAAFHDVRKSLAVTLQLVGRFTRARADLGNAVFIANTAEVEVQEELRKLYSRDPDWNELLPELNDKLVGEQVSLQEFIKGFAKFDGTVPLKRVFPALSTVVYRTNCSNWSPEKFHAGIVGIDNREQVHFTINHAANTLIVVTAQRLALKWTDAQHLHDLEWELIVAHWSKEQSLLFIHSSSNSGEYVSLAQVIAGPEVALIKGQVVFRLFARVNRLRLQNVGLSEQLGRNVRYTGRMGADIEPALSEVTRRKTTKSVLSGTGFEGGAKVTVGASQKGRIWTIRRDRVDQLVAWCKSVGTKLLDEGIDPDEVLKGTLETRTVSDRPAAMPIGIDWPEAIYTELESHWHIELDGNSYELSDVSIENDTSSIDGPLLIAIVADARRAVIELKLYVADEIPQYRFERSSGAVAQIRRGARSDPELLTDFFYEDPPTIWFADGCSLQGNLLAELRNAAPPFSADKIEVWDWTGVDIRKESQGEARQSGTIQHRVIEKLKEGEYSIIFDDDGAGEVADVVAVKLVGSFEEPIEITIDLYHCKFSSTDQPGSRIADLYEVCGQAQKSIAWVSSPDKKTDLFTHLLRRNAAREERGGSRIEIGDKDLIDTLRGVSRVCSVNFRIFVVQPGLSRTKVSIDQLQLLGVTENYLHETYQIGFGAIASN